MKKNLLFVGCLILWSCFGTLLCAQDSTSVEQLMKEQSAQDDAQKTQLATGTFESTHLIAGHSIETTKRRNMDFRISHRFARMDEGVYDMFGLDNASIRLGFDYGITDKLMVGFGRSSMDKEYDVSAKYRILRQSSGKHNMPVSLTALGELTIKTLKDPTGETAFNERLATAFQLLAARKFSTVFSAQIMPIWVHYVQTPLQGDPNDIFSIGLGGSVKVFKRVRLNVEYYPLFSGNKLCGTTAPLSVGFDVETGGHVFQLFVSNAVGTNERLFLTQTFDRWDKGQLHIGFNILRVFSFN